MKFQLYETCSLFFIAGHILGGRVTVTDGDCRIYYTITNMSLNKSFISYGKTDQRVAGVDVKYLLFES
jgi:hypothetical protein